MQARVRQDGDCRTATGNALEQVRPAHSCSATRISWRSARRITEGVADEIASDLTNMPKQELPMRLAAMLARSPSGDGARSAKRQVCTGTNCSVIGPRSSSTTDLQVG